MYLFVCQFVCVWDVAVGVVVGVGVEGGAKTGDASEFGENLRQECSNFKLQMWWTQHAQGEWSCVCRRGYGEEGRPADICGRTKLLDQVASRLCSASPTLQQQVATACPHYSLYTAVPPSMPPPNSPGACIIILACSSHPHVWVSMTPGHWACV